MGVIVKEALANGRLTVKNDDPQFSAKRMVLEDAARDLGTTLDALALAAVLAQPWANVVLSGAATREQLESNLEILNVSWNEGIRDRLASLVEEPEEYWSRRGELPWN
jgi:aryl-alcohol dehydrogenase-like predicted oxidoreductase